MNDLPTHLKPHTLSLFLFYYSYPLQDGSNIPILHGSNLGNHDLLCPLVMDSDMALMQELPRTPQMCNSWITEM